MLQARCTTGRWRARWRWRIARPIACALLIAAGPTIAPAQTTAEDASDAATASANGQITTAADEAPAADRPRQPQSQNGGGAQSSDPPAARDRSPQSDRNAKARLRALAREKAGREARDGGDTSPSAGEPNRRSSPPRNRSSAPRKAKEPSDGESSAPKAQPRDEEAAVFDPAADDPAAPDGFYGNRNQSVGSGGGGSADGGASEWTDDSAGWVLETLAALGVVIGLILLGRWVWMKLSGQASPTTTGSAAGSVEVLSRTAVAPKNHVLLLRVGNRVLVVGDSSNGLNTLAEVDDPDEVADLLTSISTQQPKSITNNFKQALSRVSGSFDQRTLDQEDGRDDAEHHFDRSRSEVSSLLHRLRSASGRGGRP